MATSIKGYNVPRQERSKVREKQLKDALVRLLAKGINYGDITNQDILDEANLHKKDKSEFYKQSLYQWFEHGKDTIVSVLAAEYDAVWEKEVEVFFSDSSHLEKDAVAFVKAFNQRILNFYKNHKEVILVWNNQSIPASLRNPSEASRQLVTKLGVDYLQKRGVGQRRYFIAPVVYGVIFFMHEQSIQPIFHASKSFDIFIDLDMEEELEQLLIRYLNPYFDEAKSRNFRGMLNS